MKKLLIHLHIYYPELYSQLESYLKNIDDFEYDLFVTMPEANADLEQSIKASFPNSKISYVDNVGYDVYPFVSVINECNLDEYSYVIKLHTKRNIPRNASLFWFYGSKWRDSLLEFIKTKDNFKRAISYLELNKNVGMHGAKECLFSNYSDDPNAKVQFCKYSELKKYEFVAGSIFVVRAELLKKFKALNLTKSDFKNSDVTHQSCQLAHIMERMFGSCVVTQKCNIRDCLHSSISNHFSKLLLILRAFCLKYILTIRITKKNKLLVKFLKLPVFSKKLKDKS